MAEIIFNDGGVATYGDPERTIYDANKKRWPEGDLMRHSNCLRIGSICPIHSKLHTVEELIGVVDCGCKIATIQQSEVSI